MNSAPTSSRGMGIGGMALMALYALTRKKSRTLLTGLGVVIGVGALTLIVSLSNGMDKIISGAISGEENLRQLSVTPGVGYKLDPLNAEIDLPGEIPEARKSRLRRAALARARHPANEIAARIGFDNAELDEMRGLPHVASVEPLITERYMVELVDPPEGSAGATPEQRLSYGIDTNRKKYADRVIAGEYFSAPDAREVMLHEYLAYQWGYLTTQELSGLIGKSVRITPVNRAADTESFEGMIDLFRRIGGKMKPEDFQTLFAKLEPEEQAALGNLIGQLSAMGSEGLQERREAGLTASEITFPMELKIVGIGRELEKGDNFNVVEDAQAYQVDVFLPHELADELYRADVTNCARGYMRLLAMVEDKAYAEPTENMLRARGYTAYSVSTALSRVGTTLDALTIAMTFLTGIALVVAALGIVNTMLTSVLERTKEIGLWKALGATRGQIRVIFLFEAAMIGLGGGLLGLLLAWIATFPGNSYAVSEINKQMVLPFIGRIFELPLWLAVTGPLLAMVVAMLAALLPAWRASAIDPVRALRDE